VETKTKLTKNVFRWMWKS